MGPKKQKSVDSSKYKWLTIKQKVEIIKKLEDGQKTVDLAKEYKTTHTTIHRTWLKREKYQSQAKSMGQSLQKRANWTNGSCFD